MPISAANIVRARTNVERDVVSGFDGLLSPQPSADPAFVIELKGSGLGEELAVATSESVVVVPWVYKCVHTGPFLGVQPTYISFDLRGATFVKADSPDIEEWLYHRFVDYLCALHEIGISTNVRPALSPEEYLVWDEARTQ
jgi:hypothetical protein